MSLLYESAAPLHIFCIPIWVVSRKLTCIDVFVTMSSSAANFSAPLSQGFGYGIVVGLGFAFALVMIVITWALKR